MLDRAKFMETLRSVQEIASVSQPPLSKEEIASYFEEMELSQEQLEMVYQYTLNPNIDDNSAKDESQTSEDASNETEEDYSKYDDDAAVQATEMQQKNSIFLEMYLEEIKDLPKLTGVEEDKYYTQLIDGDGSVASMISDHWLTNVVELAKEFENQHVNMEDLIQEGNIGLLGALKELEGRRKFIDAKEFIKESIQKAMMDYIDELHDEDDWTSAMLAKVTLIDEAKKQFAEDHVRIPTVKELADYTKLSEEEIEDILKLSLGEAKEEK